MKNIDKLLNIYRTDDIPAIYPLPSLLEAPLDLEARGLAYPT